MFLLKKFIAAVILPPGLIILLVFLIGFSLLFQRRWRSALASLFAGGLLWLLSLSVVANALLAGLEADFSIPDPAQGDVIVLLGGGVLDKAPDLSGMGAPSPLMMGRVMAAARLYLRQPLPIIVTGGRVYAKNTLTEAEVARRFFVDLGIPGDAVIEEGQARDTVENAIYTAKLCRERGFRHPILITSAFHLKRSVWAFKSAGMTVTPFPAYFLSAKRGGLGWGDLQPSVDGLFSSVIALREYVGMLYYRLTGV